MSKSKKSLSFIGVIVAYLLAVLGVMAGTVLGLFILGGIIMVIPSFALAGLLGLLVTTLGYWKLFFITWASLSLVYTIFKLF